jgi:hypothetical protein
VIEPTTDLRAIAARCVHPSPKWDDERELLFCGVCGPEIDLQWPFRYLARWSRAQKLGGLRAVLERIAA